MNTPAETRLLVVWLALSGISLLQLWVSSPDAAGALAPSFTITLGVIVLALVKVRVIMREFMEVRHAPALLMRFTDFWLLFTAGTLLGTYFVGMAMNA